MVDSTTSTPGRTVNHTLESFLADIQPWLRKKAFHFCGNEADAEDLVQDTFVRFLKAFAQAETLPPENELEAWLIAVMFRRFLDLCEKQKTEKRVAADPTLKRLTVEQPLEPKPLSESTPDEAFKEAIEKLSPAQRTTVKLRAQGLSYQDISEAQGIPIGRVGKRLSDARKKLLRMLEPFLRAGGH